MSGGLGIKRANEHTRSVLIQTMHQPNRARWRAEALALGIKAPLKCSPFGRPCGIGVRKDTRGLMNHYEP